MRNMSYRDIYQEISDYTDNFTLPEGKMSFSTRSDINNAEDILGDYYENVKKSGLDYDNIEIDGIDYTIQFNTPILIDEEFDNNGLNYIENKTPTAGPLGGGVMEELSGETLTERALHIDKKRKALASAGFNVDGLVEEEILNLYQDVCGIEPYDRDKIKKKYNIMEAISELRLLESNPEFLDKGTIRCHRCHTLINCRDAYVIQDSALENFTPYICHKCYKSGDEVLREPISSYMKDHNNYGNLKFKRPGINESTKHDKLNSDLWNDDILKTDVRNKLLEIVDKFKENLQQDEIDLDINDIVIVGSNASYNYTDTSDIDLHVAADLTKYGDKEDLALKLYQAYKSLFNNKYDPTINGHEVELYVENNEVHANSNGIYSVLNNKWIKVPSEQDIPDINQNEVDEIVNPFIKKSKNADTINDIDNIIDDIYLLRQRGILEGGEYDPRNLAFKEFRSNGYLDKLKNKKIELENKEMSLPEDKTNKNKGVTMKTNKDDVMNESVLFSLIEDYSDDYTDLNDSFEVGEYVDLYDLFKTKDCAGWMVKSDEPGYYYCQNSNDLGNFDLEEGMVEILITKKVKIDKDLYIYISDDEDNMEPFIEDEVGEHFFTYKDGIKEIKEANNIEVIKTEPTNTIDEDSFDDYQKILDARIKKEQDVKLREIKNSFAEKFNVDPSRIDVNYIIGSDNHNITIGLFFPGAEKYEEEAKLLAKNLGVRNIDVFSTYRNKNQLCMFAWVDGMKIDDFIKEALCIKDENKYANGKHYCCKIEEPDGTINYYEDRDSAEKDLKLLQNYYKENSITEGMDIDKKQSLANYLNYENTDNIDSYDDVEFITPDGIFLVLTEDEAYDRAIDEIKILFDDLGINSFTKEFQKWILDNAIEEDWFIEWVEENNEQAGSDGDILPDDDPIQLFRDTFGDDELAEVVKYNNLVDIEKVADEVISLDGLGHILSYYDGVEIDLGNGLFAYRTN